MMRRKVMFMLAVLAGIAMAGLAPPARADFLVTFSDGMGDSATFDGTTGMVTAVSGTTNAVLGNFASQSGGLTATITSAPFLPPGMTSQFRIQSLLLGTNLVAISSTVSNTNSPGSVALGTISMSNSDISNLGTTILSDTVVTITETSTGFTAPTNPGGTVGVLTSASETVNTGPSGTLTYTSFVNGTAAGSVTPDLSGPGPSYSANLLTSIASPSPVPFTISGVISLNSTHGTDLSVSSTTSVTAPAPSSLVLVGWGALSLVGRFAWKRRKVAVA